MNYTTVFESTNKVRFPAIILVDIITIILLLGVIFISYLAYKREKKEGDTSFLTKVRIKNAIIPIIAGALSIISLISSTLEIPIYKVNIYDKYIENEVSVIEGIVRITKGNEDSEESEEKETISLEGIDFNIQSKYLYNYSHKQPVCIQDGEHVRITYVTFKRQHFIVKIEKTETLINS